VIFGHASRSVVTLDILRIARHFEPKVALDITQNPGRFQVLVLAEVQRPVEPNAASDNMHVVVPMSNYCVLVITGVPTHPAHVFVRDFQLTLM
jgi:hypothetical protein